MECWNTDEPCVGALAWTYDAESPSLHRQARQRCPFQTREAWPPRARPENRGSMTI